MSTLINLVIESQQIALAISKAGGELTPEIETALDLNAANITQKIDCYIGVMKSLETLAATFKQNADDMKSAQKALENRVESLKGRLKTAHDILGQKEICGDMYKTLVYDIAPKLVIDDEKGLPAKYTKIVQKIEVDKDAIREALLAGEEIPGCRFELNQAMRISVNAKKKELK